MNLRPPSNDAARRPLSIMSTGSSASAQYGTGHAWSTSVNEDNCWDHLILTLDGGGIRGYASLLILQRLMHEVSVCEQRLQEELGPVPNSARQTFNEDELLPCHYFDYMYGTSTGGLISLLLARLRMTVPQSLEIYRKVGDDLFGHRRNVLPLATKYHHKPLEEAVQTIVREYCKNHDCCDGNDWHPWTVDDEDHSAQGSGKISSSTSSLAPTDRICQSICLTATRSGQIDEAYLLRTCDHRYNPETVPVWARQYNEGADKLKIWEVARATSAAPFFFKMLEADFGSGRRIDFKDGGIRENNPSRAAYHEHASLKGEDHEPALLLSIGTGRPDTSHDGFASIWPGPFGKVPLIKKWSEKLAVFKNMLIKYTEGEDAHETMCVIARGQHRWYKRLNVDKGLGNMKLDSWEKGSWLNPATEEVKEVPGGATLTRMEAVTKAYLERTEAEKKILLEYAPPKIVLQQVAERLVRHRRLREATKNDDLRRWQTHMGMWLSGTLKDEDAMVKLSESRRSSKSRKGSKSAGPSRRGSADHQAPRPVRSTDENVDPREWHTRAVSTAPAATSASTPLKPVIMVEDTIATGRA